MCNQRAARTAVTQVGGESMSAGGSGVRGIPVGESKLSGCGGGGGGLFGQIRGDREPIKETYIPK